jgi:arylsulfatase A
MLRYEPLPHKTTLGYWVNATDWASFEFTVAQPGMFTVEVLQGCGKGQGGSEVEVAVGEQVLKFTVEDTGHFQNFKARDIGTVKIDKAGRHTLTIKPTKKAAAAVMDVRQVTLKPVK